MEIVEADIDDTEEILTLQKIAYLSEAKLHNDDQIPPLTQTLDELKADFDSAYFIKALESGVLIGSGRARCRDNICFISRLAVYPEYQGQGIGSKLLAALERQFADVDAYELFTGSKSTANIAMYEHRGYRKFKTEMLGRTEVVFLRKLNPSAQK